MRRLRTTLAFLLFFACLASASTVSVVYPVNQTISSTESNSVVNLGSFTAGTEIHVSFLRSAGEGKNWDYALPLEAFRPSGWTTRQGTQDSLLVVYFNAPYYSNGTYLLKVTLADSDESVPPQTVSFKAGFVATGAPLPIVSQGAAPSAAPAEPINWDMIFLVLIVLCIPAILAATLYYTAPARRRLKAEEERRRKEVKEGTTRKMQAAQPMKVPTKRVIFVEQEKSTQPQRVPEQKFALKMVSSTAEKSGEIQIPMRRVIAEAPEKKTAAKEVMQEVSLEPLKSSTQDVITDIDAVLKELRPKYDWKKPGEKQALKTGKTQ
ncbi:hypothetical protein H0O03_02060 [Candidatus Micrarchaeota archaeon]|nr:hypothetical protein [Candidatus Micrarchaeota archaeon]